MRQDCKTPLRIVQVRQLRASKQAQAAPPPQALGPPAGSLSQGSMLPGGAAAMGMQGGPDASALFAAMLQRLPQHGMPGARAAPPLPLPWIFHPVHEQVTLEPTSMLSSRGIAAVLVHC